MIRLIENNCPYYIKFDFSDIESFTLSACKILPSDFFTIQKVNDKLYDMYHLSKEESKYLIDMLPFGKKIQWDDWMRIVIVKPGFTGPLHKDGINAKASINIGLYVQDELCPTLWFDDNKIHGDQTLTKFSVNNKEMQSRNIDIDWKLIEPSAQTVLKKNECIIFNSDIYHTWYNASLTNYRIILKLRPYPPGLIDFSSLHKLIFI